MTDLSTLRTQDRTSPVALHQVDLGGTVAPLDVWRIATGEGRAVVGAAARERMRAAAAVLDRAARERRVVYGLTTGFGPLARHQVDPAAAGELQHRLLLHLASGVGPPLARVHVRALMAARVATLARGHSGVDEAVVDLVLGCLARDVTPVVPERGTVGASGDLTPLAHVALVLVSEGRATVGGVELPGGEALRRAGLAPVRLTRRDGLALVNGTAAMTGIGTVNAVRAQGLAELALRCAALLAEVLGARGEAWDPRLGTARPHPGQRLAHTRLATLVQGSTRLRRAPRTLAEPSTEAIHDAGEAHQDAYTLRCVPQLLGAVLDVVAWHEGVVATELRSATDNPLVFAGPEPGDDAIVHGGNFFGQHVAFASDALMTATVQLAVWAERAVARLCHPGYNRGLPAFLHGGTAGIDAGLMGAQVTATALVAEMRTRAVPASMESIATNNDNQDVVTMGTIAARGAAAQLDLAAQVLAILALALARARDLRLAADARPFAEEAEALVAAVRTVSPPLEADRALGPELQALAPMLEAWVLRRALIAPIEDEVVAGDAGSA